MASNLMMADERVLWMAQREALACSRIIACLQKIAVYRLATAQAFSLVGPASASAAPSGFSQTNFETNFPSRRPPTSLWRLTLSAPATGTA